MHSRHGLGCVSGVPRGRAHRADHISGAPLERAAHDHRAPCGGARGRTWHPVVLQDEHRLCAHAPRAQRCRTGGSDGARGALRGSACARRQVTNIDTLRGRPLLVFTSSYQLLQEANWFQPVLDAAAIGMETNSTHALVAAATAGLGVAVLPRFVAARHPELVRISEDTAAHDVWLITHPEFRRDPKVSAMVDFLKGIAAALDPSRI